MSSLQILLAFVICTAGATLQGSIGFGLGPLAVPLLVLLDPSFIPGPLLASALVLTLLLVLREHHAVHSQGIRWAIPGRLIGSLAGAGILLAIPERNLSALFGVMVLAAIGISALRLKIRPSRGNIMAAGVLSGLMGTTAAIGGAPVALVYQHESGPRIRSTLSAIFVFGTVISLITLAAIGRFGPREMELALVLMPGTLMGFVLSRHTARVLDRGFLHPLILIVAAAMGLAVLAKSAVG